MWFFIASLFLLIVFLHAEKCFNPHCDVNGMESKTTTNSDEKWILGRIISVIFV